MTDSEPIAVGMMPGDTLLWRCLHGGPLTTATINTPDGTGRVPWAEFRDRNLTFLGNLTRSYGACAVVARSGESVVGHLRFYPKAVVELARPGLGLCLQQEFPYGPAVDFGKRTLLPLEEIEDKTLLVHCMMIAPDRPGGESFRRRGIATRMVRTLIDWAAAGGWRAIEAMAYEALPIIYETTGQTGRRFWEKLGFRLARTEPEPALEGESEFVRKMQEEATTLGLDPARLANKYVMRLDLRR